jgi:hypothetical protein
MALEFLHNSIAGLVAEESPAYWYGFAFTVPSMAGIGATEDEVAAAERIESIRTNQTSPAPLVVVPDANDAKGWRRLKKEDIFGKRHADPAYVKRFILTPNRCDAQAAERLLHLLLEADAVGFKGNMRNGGLATKQGPYLFGVGVLVIPAGLGSAGRPPHHLRCSLRPERRPPCGHQIATAAARSLSAEGRERRLCARWSRHARCAASLKPL